MRENRRAFLKKSVLATAGIAVAPAYIKGFQQVKPSDRINVGVIGIHDRGGLYNGSGHTANFTKIKETKVAAICDCVEYLLPKAISDIESLGGEKPRTFVDYRKMLEDKDLDIISIATGRKLEFDTNTEKFIGDNEANAYLSRSEGGRKPFNMPREV
jgi:hypothetical protein